MITAVTAGHIFSPEKSKLTETDDILKITPRNTKAAFGTNSPDASVLQTVSRKVKRCQLTRVTQ